MQNRIRFTTKSSGLRPTRDRLHRVALCLGVLFVLLAAVELRQGRYEDAAKIYRTLLAANPKHAAWWMGLGIALEEGHAATQARQAYGQALVYNGLSHRLRNYVRQRLAASGNTQTRPPSVGRIPDEERS